MRVAIYANMALSHQIDFARAFAEGLDARGYIPDIIYGTEAKADIHMMIGPWFALRQWQPVSDKVPVLYADRTFYGDARWSVSIGWLRPDGSRDFKNQRKVSPKGPLPQMSLPKVTRRSCLVLGDYGRDPSDHLEMAREYDAVFFRPHPRDQRQYKTGVLHLADTLEANLSLADVVIGHQTTALIDAALAGCHVQTTFNDHPVIGHNEPGWLTRLSWCNWSHQECRAGDFMEHLG